ncbi:hypothetical protein [Clostridium beijerinckii]|uniref:hypothetical protein n=1 Tax=Clostridium beijerinckii TaxID=1520 RepID=UPI0022E672B5|nr:hypothetical protein [Clostridium beijerinckii]
MKKLKDGILVNEVTRNYEGGKIIVTREMKKFDESRLDEYLNNFELYKSKGIIENSSFSDGVWNLKNEFDGYCDRHNIVFPFDIVPKINMILKFLCIDLLNNNNVPVGISSEIKIIIQMLAVSNFFNPLNYEEFEDYIYRLSDYSQTKSKDSILKYIAYSGEEINDEYMSLIGSIENVEKKSRILPDYRSILYFDYFIKKFAKFKVTDEKYKFYPIILWWMITTCIPMRPIEFTRIKKKHCYEVNGKYYIKITRAKPHSYLDKALGFRKEQTLRINKDVYQMVLEYTSHEKHSGDYLLSAEMLNEISNVQNYSDYYELITKDRLRKLLKQFYKDIILGEFNYDSVDKNEVVDKLNRYIEKTSGNMVVRLQLGDTRHLAIINLVLSGYNPLSIKELSGHDDINAHMHYYSHIQQFIDSKTIVLSDLLRIELSELKAGYRPHKKNMNRRLENLTSMIMESEDGLLYIDGGWCKRYKNMLHLFPRLCLSRCRSCNSHFKDKKNMNMDYLDKEFKEVQAEIETQIDIIKFYAYGDTKHRVMDKDNGIFNAESNRLLKTASKKLDSLITQRAKIEAYKMKLMEV